MVVVELGEAGGHLAAAGAGSGDNDQLAGGLDVFVSAEAFVADDVGDVGGVALNRVVAVNLDAQRLQTLLEGQCHRLTLEAGHHDAADIKSKAAKDVDQAQHVHVVGDAQVAANLVLLDVGGVDGDDDLNLLLELQQHPQLAVRLKSRQDARGVVVVVQLSAELQIQLSAKLRDSLPDVLRLCVKIFFIAKSIFLHNFHASLSKM